MADTLATVLRSVCEDASRVQRVVTTWTHLVRHLLTAQGAKALDAATKHWIEGSTHVLEPLRISCWQYLDEKNGNSTTIDDDEDRAMRVLICCLYEEADEFDVDLGVWFAVEMLLGVGVTEDQLADIASSTP